MYILKLYGINLDDTVWLFDIAMLVYQMVTSNILSW